MKKIILSFLLVVGVVLSSVYAVFSYIFTDESILIMLGQTKPGIWTLMEKLRQNASLVTTNRISLALVVLFFSIGVILVITKKEISKRNLLLAVLIPCVLVFAYPIVSRDIFSYLYYAKMVLVYQQNPYLVAPVNYWNVDMWIGFMHNIERVYVYGPVALLINLIPMALFGAEKFVINVFLYKFTCLIFFLLGAWLFIKISKNKNLVVALWLLNPFVINELLINGHNDLMMIVFFWLAIYLKQKSKTVLAIIAYLLSAGTKFVTAILLPIFFLPKKYQTWLSVASILVISTYLLYVTNLAWYFSWIYFCFPYINLNKLQIISILFLQLSLTLVYGGFLQYGLWGTYPSSQFLTTIIQSTKLFIPFFVIATFYPYLKKKISFPRLF